MKKKQQQIIVLISITLFIIFLIIYKILNYKYHIGIPCIFHKITGLYCPGCGITRAIFYLLDFDIKNALRCNLLLFIIFPFILIYIINGIYIWINNIKKDPSKIFSNKIWYALLIISIIYGIIRNINYFEWLRPI